MKATKWNGILQIKITAATVEDIELTGIVLVASGPGNDAICINKTDVYSDSIPYGAIDEGDELIGSAQPAYIDDNGRTLIPTSFSIGKGESKSIIVAYRMANTNCIAENHNVEVEEITAKEKTSGTEFSINKKSPITSYSSGGAPCSSDSVCASDEKCTDDACQKVSGICGYASNHTWKKHECGTSADCSACTVGKICLNNSCVNSEIQVPNPITVGEQTNT